MAQHEEHTTRHIPWIQGYRLFLQVLLLGRAGEGLFWAGKLCLIHRLPVVAWGWRKALKSPACSCKVVGVLVQQVLRGDQVQPPASLRQG